MITLGAYLGIFFFKMLGLPIYLSLLLTFLTAFGFGMLLEKGIIRIMLNKNIITIYIVLATIAVSYIIQNAAQAAFGSAPLQFPQVFSKPTLTIIGVTSQTEAWVSLAVSLILMVILHFFMTKTKFGTAMRGSSTVSHSRVLDSHHSIRT